MSTKSIQFRPSTQQPPTLSDLKSAFQKAGTTQHLRYEEGKGLYTRSKYSFSANEILAKLGNRNAIANRNKLREAAVSQIKDAIDVQYGKGMADRVFADLGLTKSVASHDLALIENKATELLLGDKRKIEDKMGVGFEAVFKEHMGDRPYNKNDFDKALVPMIKFAEKLLEYGHAGGSSAVPKDKSITDFYNTPMKIPYTGEDVKRAVLGGLMAGDLVSEYIQRNSAEMEKAASKNGGDPFEKQVKYVENKITGALFDFCKPDSGHQDIPMSGLKEVALSKVQNEKIANFSDLAKVYDLNKIKGMTGLEKCTRVENYVEALVSEPKSKANVESFMRLDVHTRGEPGYVELQVVALEMKPSIQNDVKAVKLLLNDSLSPQNAVAKYDEAMQILLGKDLSETSMQEKVNGLPEDFCRMLALAHRQIQGGAHFDQTVEDGQAAKDKMKTAVTINFLALRSICPELAVDLKDKNSLVFSKVFQNTANGTELKPPFKDEAVVQGLNEKKDYWREKFMRFGEMVVERGNMLIDK